MSFSCLNPPFSWRKTRRRSTAEPETQGKFFKIKQEVKLTRHRRDFIRNMTGIQNMEVE